MVSLLATGADPNALLYHTDFNLCELQNPRPDQTLLILMDLQRGFIPGGQWAQLHGLDVLPSVTAFNRVTTLIHNLRRDVKMASIQFVFPLSQRHTELIPGVLDLATQRTISPFFKNADNMLSDPTSKHAVTWNVGLVDLLLDHGWVISLTTVIVTFGSNLQPSRLTRAEKENEFRGFFSSPVAERPRDFHDFSKPAAV